MPELKEIKGYTEGDLNRVFGNTEFWRHVYGKAYLFQTEITPGDARAVQSKIKKINPWAARTRFEFDKAKKELDQTPVYPGGFILNEEGNWRLRFHELKEEECSEPTWRNGNDAQLSALA